MELDWNEFAQRAIEQTILAIEARAQLTHGSLSERQWFRSGEATSLRPRPIMLEWYSARAGQAGLVIPTYLNYFFQECRVKGEWTVLRRGQELHVDSCYAIHHQLSFVVTEHAVIQTVQGFIDALHESPDFAAWRERRSYIVHCPNGAAYSLYDHNGSPAFIRV